MSYQDSVLFIRDDNFEKVLDTLAEKGNVYAPEAVQDRSGTDTYHYRTRTRDKTFACFGYRPSEPLKTFVFNGRLKVAEYPSSKSADDFIDSGKTYVVGAAACDLESLKSLDAVFLSGEHIDVFYRARLDNTVIISIDCTKPRETCFCTLAGIQPYPTAGFDLNLSRIEEGYVVETGSEKGKKIIEENRVLFSPAGDDALAVRKRSRASAKQQVEAINRDYTLSRSRREILEQRRESGGWFTHVSACVECGACLFSCPTCHCFLLYDQSGGPGTFDRLRKWDVCIYAGYSRMAGGSSPRLGLMERFRHRYLHKLEYFPKDFQMEACTGCGRCIQGCMGKIDMRKVLKSLDSEITGG